MMRKGFTLIELTITLAIVALMATLVAPVLQITLQRNKEDRLYAALREIRTGIDAYKLAGDQGRIQRDVGASGYPKNLEVLVDGVPDQTSPTRTKIFFLRRIPADPMNNASDVDPAATWGKRSYASEASQPSEGDDVYDVYSLSYQVGLNGQPYRQW